MEDTDSVKAIDNSTTAVNAPKGTTSSDLDDAMPGLKEKLATDSAIEEAREQSAAASARLLEAEAVADVKTQAAHDSLKRAEEATVNVKNLDDTPAARRDAEEKIVTATKAVEEAEKATSFFDLLFAETRPTTMGTSNFCVGLFHDVSGNGKFGMCPVKNNKCPTTMHAGCIEFPDIACPVRARAL